MRNVNMNVARRYVQRFGGEISYRPINKYGYDWHILSDVNGKEIGIIL